MNEKIKSEFGKLFENFDVKSIIQTVFKPLEDYIRASKPEETKVENIKKLLEGKTIAKAEFSSYAATNDTLTLSFTDETHLKIVSDPNNVFDGLAFFVKKVRTVEQEYDEEIK